SGLIAHAKKFSKIKFESDLSNTKSEILKKINFFIKISNNIALNDHFSNQENWYQLDKTQKSLIESIQLFRNILLQNVYQEKIKQPLYLKYGQYVVLVSLILGLIIGVFFIFISRRALKRAVINEALQILEETKDYEINCLQTLNFCRDLSDLNLKTIHELKTMLLHVNLSPEVIKKLASLEEYASKTCSTFTARKMIHQNHLENIDNNKNTITKA
ncbi:MAG: hypothetical protein K2X39_10590, partial [Silvanigrellaceae bacterium]|nr:hypothetical protein [Silvanigrellaceae bacterium]